MTTKSYFKSLLPWLLLGPLTGMLAEGVLRNWRARETALAWLYGVALFLVTFDLYSLGGKAFVMGLHH